MSWLLPACSSVPEGWESCAGHYGSDTWPWALLASGAWDSRVACGYRYYIFLILK